AKCYEMVGRMDQAKAMYESALADGPEDFAALGGMAGFCLRTGKVEESKQYLHRVIALRSKGPHEAAAARRLLAMLLAVTGQDYQQAREALAAIGIQSDAGN